MMPTQKCFGAANGPALKIGLRLIVQLELTAFQRAAQAGLERSLLDLAAVHIRLEELRIVAAIFLGVMQRQVGILEQRFRVQPVVREHADAYAYRHLKIVGREVMRQNERSAHMISKKLAGELPESTLKVLRRIHLGLDAVTQMDYRVNVEGKTPREAAREWMRGNRTVVDAWN